MSLLKKNLNGDEMDSKILANPHENFSAEHNFVNIVGVTWLSMKLIDCK